MKEKHWQDQQKFQNGLGVDFESILINSVNMWQTRSDQLEDSDESCLVGDINGINVC